MILGAMSSPWQLSLPCCAKVVVNDGLFQYRRRLASCVMTDSLGTVGSHHES